jgi:hypothetical protein
MQLRRLILAHAGSDRLTLRAFDPDVLPWYDMNPKNGGRRDPVEAAVLWDV